MEKFDILKQIVKESSEKQGVSEYELYYSEDAGIRAETFRDEISAFTSSVGGILLYRCIVNGKMGYASTELMEESEMRELVIRAVENAENTDKPAENGFASIEIWLPEGHWYELHTGAMIEGGQVVTRHFALDEYGIYVKAGAVLPFYGDEVQNLNGNDEDIYANIFPGGDGCFTMYEDAGNDKNYATEYATTLITSKWNEKTQTVTIAPRNGSYAGMPAQRNFKVKVIASAAPASVTVNGHNVPYEYDGYDFAFTVDVPVTDCSAEKVIAITYEADPALADSIKGMSRRMARSIEALKFRTNADPIDDLAMLGTINEAVLYSPEKAHKLTEAFMKNYSNLPEILKKQPRISKEDIEWFLAHCGYDL